MRRRKLLVVLAGLAVVVAAGVVMLWPSPPKVTPENIDRATAAETKAEVEAILGPPDDYRTGPTDSMGNSFVVTGSSSAPLPLSSSFWVTDSGCFGFVFDASGRKVGSNYTAHVRVQQSPLENLLWRAKRQCHRWFP